jgi:hypothetical protein
MSNSSDDHAARMKRIRECLSSPELKTILNSTNKRIRRNEGNEKGELAKKEKEVGDFFSFFFVFFR